MECGRIYRFFQGLWTFKREVRSLLCHSRKLLASIDTGHASFVEWNLAPQSPPLTPQTASNSHDASLRSLLYREQGLLANHEADKKSVPAASVSRQYIYTFPTTDNDQAEAEIQVFHCSVKDRTLKVLDPWCNGPQDDLKLCFTKGEHFHDLVFSAVGVGRGGGSREGEILRDVRTKCVHYCDPDVYEGEFHLVTCQRFSIMWTVKGPNKAYSILTVYEKKLED